jgi:hypothetical protein
MIYQEHYLHCCFNTILSLFRDTESMFEVMAVSIENLLCSSVTGPQSKYNRECLILISNMGFQFWTLWTAQGSKKKKYKLLLSCFFMFSWAKLATLQIFGCEFKSIKPLRQTLLHLFCKQVIEKYLSLAGKVTKN